MVAHAHNVFYCVARAVGQQGPCREGQREIPVRAYAWFDNGSLHHVRTMMGCARKVNDSRGNDACCPLLNVSFVSAHRHLFVYIAVQRVPDSNNLLESIPRAGSSSLSPLTAVFIDDDHHVFCERPLGHRERKMSGVNYAKKT